MVLARAELAFQKEEKITPKIVRFVYKQAWLFFCSLLPPAENVSVSNLISSLLLFRPAVGNQMEIIV